MSTTKVIQLLDSKKWNAANRAITRVLEAKMTRVIAEARTKVFTEADDKCDCTICPKCGGKTVCAKCHQCARCGNHTPGCPGCPAGLTEATWHQMQAGPLKYPQDVWTVEIDPPNQARSFMTFTSQQQALIYRDNVETKNPELRGFVFVRPPTLGEAQLQDESARYRVVQVGSSDRYNVTDQEGNGLVNAEPMAREKADALAAYNNRIKKEDTDIQERPCPECHGAGDVKGKECANCDGQGVVCEAYGDSQDAQIWKGILSKMKCPDCGGKGYKDGAKCDRCKGAGEVEREKGYNYKGELKEVFGNLGIHIIKNPAGTYSFVGTLPRNLGDEVQATSADIMAGRAYTSPDKFDAQTTKFPAFKTAAEAVAHAHSRGYDIPPSHIKEAADAKCPKCGKTFSELTNGAIPKHGTIAPNKAGAYRDSKPCPGSGTKVA